MEKILKKIVYNKKLKEYCGYLTPVELIKLIENGTKPTHELPLDYIKKNISKGICNPQWFYFKSIKTKDKK